MFSFSLAKELGKTAECLLTGESGPISYRELIHWMAFSKIERAEHEQSMLASQAKANLPHYQRKL